MLCGHNKAPGAVTIALPEPDYVKLLVGCRGRWAVVWSLMELQGSAMVMIDGTHIPTAPPELTPLQIPFITLNTKGVCLNPKQLKKLKVLTIDWDRQKVKADKN